MSAIGLLTLLIAAPIGMTQAQESAWFGAATPEERRSRAQTRSRFIDLEIEPLSLRLPAAEDPYRMIQGESIHKYLREIVAISERSRLDGESLWGRIGGTKYERMTARYLADKFEEFGLDRVWMETFPRNPQWWPMTWEVTIVGDDAYGERSLDVTLTTAFPAAPSPSTPGGGVEAELVYVGLGRPVDLVGKDVRGRIAVLHSTRKPGAYTYSDRGVARRLAQAGAVGLIAARDFAADVQSFPGGAGSTRIPCFTVSGADSAFLMDVLGRGGESNPLRGRLQLEIEARDGLETQNVYGLIRGETEEYVILTAHLDAYFYGAYDNATGLATLVHLAEYFARKESSAPRRNILFIGTGAHHSGLPGTPYTSVALQSVGTAWFAEHHDDILQKTALVLNVEHTAQTSLITGLGGIITTNTDAPRNLAVTNRSPLLLRIIREAFDRYGIVVPTRTSNVPDGDASNLFRSGATVINLLASGDWYHSTGDTPETIPVQGLERTARAFAYFLERVDKASISEIERDALPSRR
ncbi:M28 family peptidase [Candidatus Sumerlaeota bacterium]|nr:M28 family peptidase [Candidatus Sumerlaeota bacterium]